jgi:hypothetical protein
MPWWCIQYQATWSSKRGCHIIFFLYHCPWRGSRIMDYRSTKLRHCPDSSSDWSSQELRPVRDILYTLGPYRGVNTLFSSGPYLQPKVSCHTSPHICQRYRFQEQMSPRAKTLLPSFIWTFLRRIHLIPYSLACFNYIAKKHVAILFILVMHLMVFLWANIASPISLRNTRRKYKMLIYFILLLPWE